MLKNLSSRFKDDRKYVTIVFFILALLLLTGVLTPVIVHHQKENWETKLSDKISAIESSFLKEFRKFEGKLSDNSKLLKNELKSTFSTGNLSYGQFVKTLNQKKYDEYSLEILAPNGKLIAWNSTIAVPQEEIFPLEYPLGETYFFRADLITYLTITDTFAIESDIFYLVSSLPFEKHYSTQNKYFKEINSPLNSLSDQSTQAEIFYGSVSPKVKDGRKYAFDITNNNNNKIGQVVIAKPLLDAYLNKTSSIIESIQSIFVFLILVFLGFAFRKEFNQLSSSLYKIFLLTIYLVSFRYIIYRLGFPSNLVEGSLTNPAYFSSAFGGGIVRSPIEFFITAVFFTILCYNVYQYWISKIFEKSHKWKYNVITTLFVFVITLSLLFFLGFRGLSASLRSVIFDSTLRYFREQDVIFDVPLLVMNVNVLLLSFSVVLILTAIVVFLQSKIRSFIRSNTPNLFFILYVFFIAVGLVFILVQNEPLITYTLLIVFITIIFILAYFVVIKFKSSKFVFVHAALCGSVISILLLNFFNLELEKESLKNIAAEMNRPNDHLIRFMISEVLLNSMQDEKILNAYLNQSANYSSEAFIMWSRSLLQREMVNSTISFLDKSGNILGQFWTGDEFSHADLKSTLSIIKNDPVIFELKADNNSEKRILTGLAPINNGLERRGFIAVTVEWSPGLPIFAKRPEFLQSRFGTINSVVDFSQLKIFKFNDSKLVQVYGDIYPSKEQILPILDADFGANDDLWLTLDLNEEKYLTYVLRYSNDEDINITSISLLEKRFSWNLYNFFKMFIVHVIFIIIFFLILFLSNAKSFRYTFRFQLMAAFLFISLIPVIILALYNRQIVEKSSNEAIVNELNEKAKYIENYIQSNLNRYTNDTQKLLEDAAHDLGISFAFYDNTRILFNSKEQYYLAGLIPERINPQVYYNLNYLSFRECSIKEKIENYYFNSLYKKVSLNDKNYILTTNDLFNEVKLTLSPSDFDVLLFGVYFLAALIIILISTVLADKISLPVRRLTKATASVAQGDLNITLKNDEKGELKDLFDGFNSMTNELKKNQTELAELERESAWKEMAKQVAHEIKNPLTPMKLSVQQLMAAFRDKNKSFDDIFQKVSATLLNQIESLSTIASEFSHFAKMPSFKVEAVDLRSILNDTVNLFADELVSFEIDVPNDLPKITADNSHLRRLIINLIRNSIQANADKIKFRGVIQDNVCILFVEDNGKGIPINVQDKIFEQNFTTKEAGMGLGLKLAKRFMDGIGGSIELVESNETGTKFKLVFHTASK